MLKIKFKNTITHNNFEQIIDINEKINKIRERIANNVFTSFHLEINEFDLIENGPYGENGFPINENENITLEKKYDNAINYVAFYIRPRTLINEECPVCYENISYFSNQQTFNCPHVLCNECHFNWLNNCNANNRVFNCPLCRKV
jgi:hypothetical protein